MERETVRQEGRRSERVQSVEPKCAKKSKTHHPSLRSRAGSDTEARRKARKESIDFAGKRDLFQGMTLQFAEKPALASALHQGTTLVVPKSAQNKMGFSPCGRPGLKPNLHAPSNVALKGRSFTKNLCFKLRWLLTT